MINGHSIFLRTFGTFKLVTKKPKKARNITAGTAVYIPEQTGIKFKPAIELAAQIKVTTILTSAKKGKKSKEDEGDEQS
jgi:nucleoid DNA-binding protein